MSDKKFEADRKTPPEDDEWPSIWATLDSSRKSWVIVKPIYEVVTNWKAIALVFAGIAWINRPEIAAAIKVLVGVTE